MNKTNFLKTLEFLTVVGFGIAYFKYNIMIATMVLMGLMTLFHEGLSSTPSVPIWVGTP